MRIPCMACWSGSLFFFAGCNLGGSRLCNYFHHDPICCLPSCRRMSRPRGMQVGYLGFGFYLPLHPIDFHFYSRLLEYFPSDPRPKPSFPLRLSLFVGVTDRSLSLRSHWWDQRPTRSKHQIPNFWALVPSSEACPLCATLPILDFFVTFLISPSGTDRAEEGGDGALLQCSPCFLYFTYRYFFTPHSYHEIEYSYIPRSPSSYGNPRLLVQLLHHHQLHHHHHTLRNVLHSGYRSVFSFLSSEKERSPLYRKSKKPAFVAR